MSHLKMVLDLVYDKNRIKLKEAGELNKLWWLYLKNNLKVGFGKYRLEYTNKQTLGTHHNKRFHKSTVSAEDELSETLLGRG